MKLSYVLCVHMFVFYSRGLATSDRRLYLATKDEPGMIGGTPTTIEKAPYVAAILRGDGKFRRLGAIIGKKFILTSAFMEEDEIDDISKVRVGSTDCTRGGQVIDMEKITKHELYDNEYSYEVGIIKLVSDIQYSETVKPIKLANISAFVGSTATLYGFTPVKENNTFHLTKGIQTVVSKRKCKHYYVDEFVRIDESNLCAYNSSVCACRREIAAPFVQSKQLIAFFVGGTFCCEERRPQVYVDVPSINGWAMTKLKEQGHDERENYGHYFGE